MKHAWAIKSAAAAAIVTGIVAGGTVAANATTTYPEGGTWSYGKREYSSTTYLYSEYFHRYRTHKASTINYQGTVRSSGWVSAGNWAKAPEQAGLAYDLFGRDHWYYNLI